MPSALGNTPSMETRTSEKVQGSPDQASTTMWQKSYLQKNENIFPLCHSLGQHSHTRTRQFALHRQNDFYILFITMILSWWDLGIQVLGRRNLRQGFCLSRINSHLVTEDLWMVLLLLQKESDTVDNDTSLDLAVPLKAQTEPVWFKK